MVRPVNQPAPAGFGRTGNNGAPPPAARPPAPVRNDRPPTAQPVNRPVEQPRPAVQPPAESRPAVETRREEPPAKKAAKKGDKTEKKDR